MRLRLHPPAPQIRRGLAAALLTYLAAGGVRADTAPTRETKDTFRSGPAEIQAIRFEPAGTGKRPAVILLHGADGWGRMAGYRYAAGGLTRTGHVAVLIRYYDRTRTPDAVPAPDRADFGRWLRGEAGWLAAARARWHFGEWAAAVRDAIAYARALPAVDPDRVAVVGFSLGGYLALAAAPTCDPPVKAVVEMFGGVPEEARKTLGKLPPTLILHGAEDSVVSVTEAYKAAGVVLAQKQYVEIDVRPGVGHVFVRPETGRPDPAELRKGRTRMTEFLERQLRPATARQVAAGD